MGLISRLYNFTSGNTIRSSEVNAEFNQMLNVINGNLDQNNLAANSVNNSQMASAAVTAEKVSGFSGSGSVSLTNIPDGVSRKAVDSSISSDNITHAETTHKRSYFVVAIATTNENSNSLTFEGGYARADVTTGSYRHAKLPLDIPDGANFKLIKVIGNTNTYGEIKIQLLRKDNSNNSSILASAAASGGESSAQYTFTDTIDHSNYSYFVQLMAKVSSGGVVTDAKLYKVYLEYTTTNLMQL